MADKTGIEWTDATWNPIVGCSIVSPGCTNCYAMRMAARIDKMTLSSHYEGVTRVVNGKPVWTGKVALANPHIFTAPLRWKRGRRIFVNSMSDLFHENLPDQAIDKVFAVMALCPQHTFQILTKRPERMRAHLAAEQSRGRIDYEIGDLAKDNSITWGAAEKGARRIFDSRPLPNVWLGVSVEDQATADERIHELRLMPAAKRFISAEPLLGPINLTRLNDVGTVATDGLRGVRVRPYRDGEPIDGDQPFGKIDWVIAGGESGPGARPMHPDWARALRDQCAAAGVAFFFKQWGEWTQGENIGHEGKLQAKAYLDGEWFDCADDWISEEDNGPLMYRVGKKAAGHLLDGREHREFPR